MHPLRATPAARGRRRGAGAVDEARGGGGEDALLDDVRGEARGAVGPEEDEGARVGLEHGELDATIAWRHSDLVSPVSLHETTYPRYARARSYSTNIGLRLSSLA